MTDRTLSSPRDRITGRAFLHRELLFVLLLSACGVIAFFGIRALAESNAAIRAQDAAAWHIRGRDLLASGDTAAALRALRRAARINPASRDISFELASVLSAAGQTNESAEVLSSLRDSRPDDPEANIELARLELTRNNVQQSIRYYQDALDSLWMPDAAERSRAIRVEFIHALLHHGERGRALAQTLVLAADLPADATAQIEAGQLFLSAGDARRALDRFSAALAADPDNRAALVGAGEASFELGDYQRARRSLAISGSSDARVAEMREVAALMLSADPLAPRLGRMDRIARIDRVREHAETRLQMCGPAANDTDPRRGALRQELAALREAVRRRSIAPDDDRDRAERAVEVALRVEQATANCGQTDAFSRAVQLFAGRHGLEGPR